MDLVAILSGAVSVRLIIEEVLPKKRVPIQDLLGAVAKRYSFMSMGEVATPSPILFQNGKLTRKDRALPIIQLQMMQGGDIVFASDTEEADEIMNDFLAYLVSDFGYDMTKGVKKKNYLSAVVVEFEKETKNLISSMSMIENIINKASLSEKKHLKRVAFGILERDPGIPTQAQQTPLDTIEAADFLIERRLGSAPDNNRFFSSAPMRTAEHISMLEDIEKLMSQDFL